MGSGSLLDYCDSPSEDEIMNKNEEKSINTKSGSGGFLDYQDSPAKDEKMNKKEEQTVSKKSRSGTYLDYCDTPSEEEKMNKEKDFHGNQTNGICLDSASDEELSKYVPKQAKQDKLEDQKVATNFTKVKKKSKIRIGKDRNGMAAVSEIPSKEYNFNPAPYKATKYVDPFSEASPKKDEKPSNSTDTNNNEDEASTKSKEN